VHANGHEIFVEASTVPGSPLSAAVATMTAGQVISEHVHAHETEVLYFTDGSGTVTVGGVAVAVGETSVIQLPPNTKHGFTMMTTAHALQIYAPAGPEQQFK
jgi:mannose-6-phosphate isomerase-like protein (cupin superfamily)